jgi:hypothetical protein
MRNLAFAVVALAVVTGGFVGCGGSTTRKPATGSAGANGTAGTTGTAGTGTAGTASAGTTGAAGDSSMAGTTAPADGGNDAPTGTAGTAAAGTTGAAGDGTAGTTAPIPQPCDNVPNKALPYAIEADFNVAHVLTNGSVSSWKNIANPTCDATTFPPFPVLTTDAGADAATDAGADGGVGDAADASDDTLTLQLDDPDAAADGGVADALDAGADAASDAIADAHDAGPAIPACYEFAYDPDACVAAGSPACWSGVIFQTSDTDLRAAGPGVCIAPGAMAVSFMARASRDGARIKFGSIREGMDSTEHYLTLTTAWASYTSAIPAAEPYDTSSVTAGGGVWNGFSVVTDPVDHVGGSYILVKDITWKAQ